MALRILSPPGVLVKRHAVGGGLAQQLGGGLVDLEDVALAVGDDDGLEDGLQHGVGELKLHLACGRLRSRAGRAGGRRCGSARWRSRRSRRGCSTRRGARDCPGRCAVRRGPACGWAAGRSRWLPISTSERGRATKAIGQRGLSGRRQGVVGDGTSPAVRQASSTQPRIKSLGKVEHGPDSVPVDGLVLSILAEMSLIAQSRTWRLARRAARMRTLRESGRRRGCRCASGRRGPRAAG